MRPEEQAQRAAVIAEARSWIGTPWHHRARVKGHGVDCGQFIAEIFIRTGCVPEFDTGDYSMQHHLHRSDELVIGWAEQFSAPVEWPEPGDLALFKFGKCFSHIALVTAWPIVIHSLIRVGVIEQDATQVPFLDRADALLPVCFYSHWRTPA